MDYTQAILTVNASCIVILTILALILLLATRFRGENGYAAVIIVLPTIPVYLYNASRMLGWHEFSLALFPVSCSVNTLLMPLLWLFARRNLESDFRLGLREVYHLLPALLCGVTALVLSPEERMASILHEVSGTDSLVGDLNTGIVALQMLLYFPAIFYIFHRERHLVRDAQSDAEWIQKAWIHHFMVLFASLFVVVMVCYAIWPRTDAWLIQILNVAAMAFLVYSTIAHPVAHNLSVSNPSFDNPKAVEGEVPALSEPQMESICRDVSSYLEESKAYLRPEYTLASLAQEVKIPQRNISRSINSHLKCNFFTLINRFRVDEAKRLLLDLDASGYTIDSICLECGFRSRSTFFLVFKKLTGQSPAAWLSTKGKKRK